jgi:hypothetical protein
LSILGSVLSTPTIIGTLSSSVPSNTYLIGTLAIGDRIYTNLTWSLPTTGTFTVVICWNKNSNNIYSTNHTISPVNLNYTTKVAG